MGSCCSKGSSASSSKKKGRITPDPKLPQHDSARSADVQATANLGNSTSSSPGQQVSDGQQPRWAQEKKTPETYGIPPNLANAPNRLRPLHEEPVQLIKPLTDNKAYTNAQFALTDEGRSLLSGISKNLSVIAISGIFCHGKSFLMNQIYGVQKDFELGSTTETCTRGVWVWAFEQVDKDEALLLLDFEGLSDPTNHNQGYDLQLFSLAVLLSSTLIFNRLSPTVDQEQIKNLSACLDSSGCRTRLRSNPEGLPETDDQYFTRVMTESLGLDPETRDYNATITTIRTAFRERHVRRMPAPYEHMESLRKLLDLVTRPKQIYSAEDLKSKCVTGPDYPDNQQCVAMKAMVQQYNNAMSAPFALHDTLPEQEIFENHCEAQAAAVRGFVDAVLNKDAQLFIDELKSGSLRGTSQPSPRGTQAQGIKKKNFKTFSDYEAACRSALEQFDTEARGPAARVIGGDFAEALNRDCELQALAYQISAAEREALETRIKHQQLEEKLKDQASDIEKSNLTLEALKWQHEQELVDIREKMQADHEEWLENQNVILENRLHNAKEWMEWQMRNKDATTKSQIDAAQRIHEGQIQSLKNEIAKDEKQFSAACAAVLARVSVMYSNFGKRIYQAWRAVPARSSLPISRLAWV
ncbi:guanylate-binding protein [Geranomyces variabilis]|nr:guanylate-binding protein [Geranomyces variabilis]KAJ3136004.1 Guanylate-binding protein 5 [Geranomyces variabilis]